MNGSCLCCVQIRCTLRTQLAAVFPAMDEDGSHIKVEDRAIMVALREQKPVHRRSFVRGSDGAVRKLEGIAFPLLGMSGRCLGAVGIFWGAEDATSL